jgi:2-oxoglutarate dehydrogenase E1 component
VQRGTFMHRHAVWHDQSPDAAGATFVPLQGLASDAARFEVVNSILSEAAVLGFEYGRSVQAPRSLVLWEAQFGDFVNGAQVVVDQYIAGGERKWGHRCALTVLLPHGHEGVGPEHSSAHLNRFLDLCADDNLRVACPSTSVQWFRLLRRQALAAQRKPLVALTPKGTLYAEPAAQSPLREFLDGDFRPVLDDEEVEAWAASRAVLCSGKLYYDLLRGRQALGAGRVALLRLEQFHPFPHDDLARVLARYPGLRTLVWAQEEQRNQGAWNFVRDELAARCPARAVVALATRPATAAGATASAALHRREQDELVARALGGGDSRR